MTLAGKRYWLYLAALAAVYFAAAVAGQRLAPEGIGVTPILPQAGIALVALLLLGYRLWPGVAAGAFLANLLILADAGKSTPAIAGVSLVIAGGCTLEVLAGTYLYKRFIGPHGPLHSVKGFLKFFALVALLSTAISAAIGLAGLKLGGIIPEGDFGRLAVGWWLGGEASVLIIVPFLMSWTEESARSLRFWGTVEALAFTAVVLLVLQAIILGVTDTPRIPAWVGLLIPFFISSLIWLALRHGEQGVTSAIFVTWVVIIVNTLLGLGSMVQDDVFNSLLNVQASWSALAIVVLIPAGAIAEGKRSNKNLQVVKSELENRAVVLGETNAKLENEITERRRVEQELSRSNAELQQFAYVTSHDLQEPLRMVTSYVQLLQRRYGSRLDSDADEFIEFAVDGAARMQKMIEDLLAYSRVSTLGKPFGATDTEDALLKALANLETLIKESGAEVSHNGLPTIEADSSQLVHLFQNLVGNAIKFHGEERPRIRVSAHQEGQEWIFSVSDNGIGIKPEQNELVFEIFQRLHSREKYPGTGIGLAICKKIVTRHGGRIWVESEPGQGSTFFFAIPEERGGRQ